MEYAWRGGVGVASKGLNIYSLILHGRLFFPFVEAILLDCLALRGTPRQPAQGRAFKHSMRFILSRFHLRQIPSLLFCFLLRGTVAYRTGFLAGRFLRAERLIKMLEFSVGHIFKAYNNISLSPHLREMLLVVLLCAVEAVAFTAEGMTKEKFLILAESYFAGYSADVRCLTLILFSSPSRNSS